MSLLAHRVDGKGPPLLLLNGGMMSYGAWGTFASALAAEWRVVRCDLRGQLLSAEPPPERLSEHAADVVALLDHLGIGKVHLLGASFGAEVALYAAAFHPERVASLVAVTAVDRFASDPAGGTSALPAACREAANGGDRGRVYDLIVDETFTPAWAASHAAELTARRAQVALLPPVWFAGLVGLLDSLGTVELAPHLGAIRCPTLVVAAGGDRIMPFARTKAVADGIRGARLEVVEGSGHAILLEAPEPLLRLCRKFLTGLR